MFDSRISLLGSVSTLTALGLGLVLGLVAAPLTAEDEGLPLRFNANAINIGNAGPRGSARLEIRITRWSTEEERTELLEALKGISGRSSRELPNALFRQESVGFIRETQSVANDLRYSRRIATEEGQQIILAVDRPLAFAETSRSSRTRDYNVTLIVLTLDAEGRGDGQIMLGAEFNWDEENNQIEITHFSSQPVRLTDVRPR